MGTLWAILHESNIKSVVSGFSKKENNKKTDRASKSESAIKQHADTADHNINPRDAQILECGVTKYPKGFSWSRSTLRWTETPLNGKTFLRAYVSFF